MEQCGTKEVEASGEDGSTYGKPTVTAEQATETMKQAADAAPAAAASKQAAEAEQAEKTATTTTAGDDDDATDSKDEEDDGMTSLEYIVAYKVLPPFEVELILQKPLERTPFADSYAFKALSADPNATQDDVDLALEEQEAEEDIRIRFRQRVRSEYAANGYVTVSDEYVAMRVRNKEVSSRLWEEAFAGFDDEIDVEEEVAP